MFYLRITDRKDSQGPPLSGVLLSFSDHFPDMGCSEAHWLQRQEKVGKGLYVMFHTLLAL